MGENTPELISPIIFTYGSLFTKQNTIDPEDTENYWVKMLPKNRLCSLSSRATDLLYWTIRTEYGKETQGEHFLRKERNSF